MGTRGPVPKRSEQRRRRNTDTAAPTESAPASVSKCGPAPPKWLTGLGRRWYEALRTSGQAVYYVDSDWATALVVARGIQAFEAEPQAAQLTAVLKGAAQLMATESDRRRLRLELDRSASEPEGVDEVSWIEDARRRLRADGG